MFAKAMRDHLRQEQQIRGILQDRHILLGVTGSIACYKAIDLASKLTQAGALVDVLLTDAAREFVTPLAFSAVTGRATYTSMWETSGASGGLPTHIAHIGLAERAEVFIIAPATAQHLAKLAHGFADDLLCVTALACRCPVLVAPAGDGHMLEHPAVIENLRILQTRGVKVIEPETGRHASGLVGRGRLPETATLMAHIRHTLGKFAVRYTGNSLGSERGGVLLGRRVVITAGGTREALDPVRYIGNRSSGKQGHALTEAALDAGAEVTLITASDLPAPATARVIRVESAEQMMRAVMAESEGADALIMAAAVADYRAETVAIQKIKKTDDDLTLYLERTADILAAVGERKAQSGMPRVLVGFAAETQDLLENAQGKLERKNADMIVANDVSEPGAGFAGDTNAVTLLYRDGKREALALQGKEQVARRIVYEVAQLLG